MNKARTCEPGGGGQAIQHRKAHRRLGVVASFGPKIKRQTGTEHCCFCLASNSLPFTLFLSVIMGSLYCVSLWTEWQAQ